MWEPRPPSQSGEWKGSGAAPGLSGLCPAPTAASPPPPGSAQGAPPPARPRPLLDPEVRSPPPRSRDGPALRFLAAPGVRGARRVPTAPPPTAPPPEAPVPRPARRPRAALCAPSPGRAPGRTEGGSPSPAGPDADPVPRRPGPAPVRPPPPRTVPTVGAPEGSGCATRSRPPPPPGPQPAGSLPAAGGEVGAAGTQVGGTGAAGPAPAARDPRTPDPGPGPGPRTPDPDPADLPLRAAPLSRLPLGSGSGSGSGRAAHGRPLQASPRLRCPRPARRAGKPRHAPLLVESVLECRPGPAGRRVAFRVPLLAAWLGQRACFPCDFPGANGCIRPRLLRPCSPEERLSPASGARRQQRAGEPDFITAGSV
ncbi:basic proline-rich protein-like [Myotis myotis]|uniref:basic proline-rich protein-like n=1 Tax=Myotis myotis TaxID=51298 RepID=UPI001749D4E5|nr:basic proline-rich protein-like [Myotis myotis]